LSRRFAAVIMGAGKSTRMKSALPKGAYLIRGKAVTGHIVDACMGAAMANIMVVAGHASAACSRSNQTPGTSCYNYLVCSRGGAGIGIAA